MNKPYSTMFSESQQTRTRTPIKGTEKLNEAIADHDNRIYTLATEATKLKDRIDSLSNKTSTADLARLDGEQRVQEKYEYHIRNLEDGKASLSKRLSIVLMELDKVTAEKADYERQMAEQLRINAELEEKIVKSENLSKVLSKNLQDDLRREKDLNDQLRSELARYETQKSQLLVQLREQQEIEEEFQGEVRRLEDNIRSREGEISSLVELHEKTKKEMSDLEAEAAALRERLRTQGESIEDLETEVQKVEGEKGDLIARMNDLTNKYDAYVSTMSREREELANTARRHIKLLTTKILSERLGTLLKKQYYASVSNMTTKVRKDYAKHHMAERVCSVLSKMAKRELKIAFQKWYQTLLNWPDERHRREQLLANIVRDRAKRSGFRKWLQWHRAEKDTQKETTNAAKRLWYKLESLGRNAIQEAFLRMKQQWLKDSKQKLNLNKVVIQKHKRGLRLAFETWRVGAKKIRQRLAFEYLASQLAQGHMRQIAFHRLKDAVRQSRIEKLIVKFRMFRYWKNARRKKEQIRRAAVLTLKIEKAEQDRLARRVFHVLQQNRAESQLKKLAENLETAVNQHKDLENTLHATKDKNEASNKGLAIKRLACHLANRVYPYFAKWQRYCAYHRRGLSKLRLLMYTVYRNKLAGAVALWRANAKRTALGNGDLVIEKAMRRIQELELEQLEKENVKRDNENMVKNKIEQKLSKDLVVVARMHLRRCLRQWDKNAKLLQGSEKKLDKMCRRLADMKKWLALLRLREQVKEQVTTEMWEKRIGYLRKKAADEALKRSLRKLKLFAQRVRKAKNQALKAIKRYGMSEEKWAFQEWLRAVREHRIAEKQAEAKALKEQERKMKNKHEELVDENKRLERKRQERQNTLKQKTLFILWNNAVRQKRLDREAAFRRWRLTALTQREKEKRSHKVFKEIILSNERKAFNKWLKLVREKHLQEKLKDLEEKKTYMKVSKNKSQLEVNQKVAERGDAEKLLERAKQSAGKTHAIAERILGQLIRKRDLNVYQPLREAVLGRWKEVANKQRQLAGRLMNLSKRHMLEHIFIKLKNATIEKTDLQRRHRAFEKMLALAGRSHLKSAFDKWKNEVYDQQNQDFTMVMENRQKEIQGVRDRIERVNDRLYSNAEMILKRKLKEKAFHALANLCAYRRALKDKVALFRKNKNYMRAKYAVQKWRSRAGETQRLALKENKATAHANKNAQRRALRQFKDSVQSTRRLPKVLNKLANKMFMHNLVKANFVLKRFANSHVEHLKATRESGGIRVGALLEKLFRARVMTYLGILGANAKIIQSRNNKLARAVVTMYLRRLRGVVHVLGKARAKKELAESVEQEGKQAQRARELQEEVELMNDTLMNEGYEQAAIERRVAEISSRKEDLIRKAIARWLAYQNNNDDVIQAVEQWKKFAEEKSAIKNSLKRLLNFLGNRDLHKGFTRWRNCNRRTKEQYRGYTKDDLVEEAMEKGKKRAAVLDDVSRKKEDLAEKEMLLRKLEVKNKLSKYFAFTFILRQNKGVVWKALQRWRENVNRIKSALLRIELDELSLRIKDTIIINDDLETKNSSLVVENEELRQLSLESVDLVTAMKELNKQKEQLSVDLADRAATIRKLLEDNKILKNKLSMAQKEAETGFGMIGKSVYQVEQY